MRGYFMDGSVTGLRYEADSLGGRLDAKGCFEYQENETITFFIGKYPIGSTRAKKYVTPMDFVAEATGRINKITHFQVTNTTRLLLSIREFGDEKESSLGRILNRLPLSMDSDKFGELPELKAWLEENQVELISVHRTHNLLRWIFNGVIREQDVKIPTRDGRHVLGTIYRPLEEGHYPVIMCMGVFGKSFVCGQTCNEEDEVYFDEVEDAFYSSYDVTETKHLMQQTFFRRMLPCFPSGRPVPNTDPSEKVEEPSGPPNLLVPVSEAFEQPVAYDWVPYGYVVINVEEYGVGANDGDKCVYEQFGYRNACDYCDAIEWAAEQPWSSGKVGLFGASFYAMTQYLAAQFHPKGLAAMIPICGDYDSYRDYVYSGGGLFNRADNLSPVFPPVEYNFMDHAMDHPFWSEEAYGPHAKYVASADISQIDYPIWPVTEPDASLHAKGSSEAYINCSSKNKKYMLLNSCGIHYWMYNTYYLDQFRAFMDHWLKGVDNDIMEQPPVQIQIRKGNGTYRWRKEQDWPVPGTNYMKFYLASELDENGNAGLVKEASEEEGVVTYNADVYHSELHRVKGATFISEPMEEDIELAGYIKANLFVSSTTKDMEIHMYVRVLDEDGEEVIYPASTTMEPNLPLGFGSMRVSHRALDEEKSRDYLPVYKHTEEAYQPLVPGEIVEAQVGSFPTSGLIRKGWRLQLDIDPVDNRWVDYKEEEYRKGSSNSIHTGVKYPSYVQIPVLPKEPEA
jgi:uncharacterized protein